jgi:CRP-like cAMP-binding protein
MFKAYPKTHASTVMDQQNLQRVREFAVAKHFAQGHQIHDRGDYKPGLSVVAQGEVKVGNYGLDGQYQLTAILRQGDTFGEFTLFANLPRTHNAQAYTDCEVLHLSERAFDDLIAKYPDFLRFMLASIAVKLHITLERLDDVLRLPTHVQLAKLLFQLSQVQQTNDIKLRQSDCAERLGVTVLSAHKAIKKLLALELITTSYGMIHISNLEQLALWLEDHLSLLPLHNHT